MPIILSTLSLTMTCRSTSIHSLSTSCLFIRIICSWYVRISSCCDMVSSVGRLSPSSDSGRSSGPRSKRGPPLPPLLPSPGPAAQRGDARWRFLAGAPVRRRRTAGCCALTGTGGGRNLHGAPAHTLKPAVSNMAPARGGRVREGLGGRRSLSAGRGGQVELRKRHAGVDAESVPFALPNAR